MASRRGYHVQYSTKRTNQVKRRPWTSPGTAGEIFDRLKSSVSSFSVEEAESLNQGSSHSEKETSRDFDEGISSQSSPETREKVTKDSRLMYSYSHYPRSVVHALCTLCCACTNSCVLTYSMMYMYMYVMYMYGVHTSVYTSVHVLV